MDKNPQVASRDEAIRLRNEALQQVADTLEKCIDEYEFLSKMEFEMVDDPSRAPAVEKADEESPQAEAAAEDAKDDDKEEDKKDDDKDEDEEDSNEDIQKGYEFFLGKMYERGLMKSEKAAEAVVTEAPAAEVVAKSEAAQTIAAPKADEVLAKAVDARVESLTKTVETLTEAFNKFSAAPAAPRKGLAGYQPLRKSEGHEEQSLSKSEIVEGLLKAQQLGDRRVDPSLINRVERSVANTSDLEVIQKILAKQG